MNYRLQFKKSFQEKLFLDIISKEKLSQRKLAKLLGISRNTIKNWYREERLLPETIFVNLNKMFPWTETYSKFLLDKVPSNWGQIKGGKIRGKMKSNLTKSDRIKGFRKANLTTFKRKIIGPKGERMYNIGEKKIADFLIKNGFDYEYESVVNLGKNYAIPDFLVGDHIIERCGYSDWNVYWSNIRRKFKLFNKYKTGKIIALIPKKHFTFAVKKLYDLNNIIILREEDIEVLPKLFRAQGPITTIVVGKAQHGRAAGS